MTVVGSPEVEDRVVGEESGSGGMVTHGADKGGDEPVYKLQPLISKYQD
jgi:hypothetical protein